MYHKRISTGTILLEITAQQCGIYTKYIVEYLATVITNLLSAIPWIGQDFVEFVTILITLFILQFILFITINTPESKKKLITIGKVNTRALRGQKERTQEEPFFSIP